MADWAADAVFYHIYPLGMCGTPERNSFHGEPEPRLAQIHAWIPHLRSMGVSALYLGPLFESTAHGYDTADYYWVDRRLGSNQTLADLTQALRDNGIRTILDGVFHHVGRDFWAFRDLQTNGQHSPYRDWFIGVDFSRQSPYGDSFAYDGWRGHYDLVKLNLRNPAVREHLFQAVRTWVEQFGIDGLRLDVAEDIEIPFLQELARFCRTLRPDFWLLGEVIHGDYRHWANPETLHSVTNYEVYKGLYSSHNDRNYFELAHSLQREFGEGGMYRGLPLYNFVDNHDVNRVASTLRNPGHLYPLYALLFTIPGIPSVYYGSEWGIGGTKGPGDDRPLRPCLQWPDAAHTAPHPDLADAITRLGRLRHEVPALRRGSYRQVHVAHDLFAFLRQYHDQSALVVANAAAEPARLEASVPLSDGTAFADLLNLDDTRYTVHGGKLMVDSVPACWARVLVTV